jgi:hypothetical protein
MSTEIKERRPPLDTPAAACYLSVLPSYLERLRCNGDGPVFIKRNGLVRYDPNDLDTWLEAGKRQSTSCSAGALYDRMEGRQRWARIEDGDQIKGIGYHDARPDDGNVYVPVVHEDSEPFDIATHWRLAPQYTLVDVDGVPDRVICTYPVVLKSWEHA